MVKQSYQQKPDGLLAFQIQHPFPHSNLTYKSTCIIASNLAGQWKVGHPVASFPHNYPEGYPVRLYAGTKK